MYRDEVQALRARVETVQAELEAVRALRRAAEARRRLAEARVAGPEARTPLWRRLRLALAVVALSAACLYGGWRLFGSQHPSSSEQPGAVPADCEPSALLVHVHPPGASLLVDGALLTDETPAEGMLVPVAPRSAVEVVALKDGFLPKRLLVETADCGVQHVFIAARRQRRLGEGKR